MAELALVDRELREVPADVARSRGGSCTTLNLSENAIRPPGNLAAFTALQTLILDKNGLESLEGFPRLPTLRTLWINHNLVRARGGGAEAARAAEAGLARPTGPSPPLPYCACVDCRPARLCRPAVCDLS